MCAGVRFLQAFDHAIKWNALFRIRHRNTPFGEIGRVARNASPGSPAFPNATWGDVGAAYPPSPVVTPAPRFSVHIFSSRLAVPLVRPKNRNATLGRRTSKP